MRLRSRRALILPRYLEGEASKLRLAGKARDRAYEILVRWADLESAGHLPRYKERSVDATFLNDVFGEALGYALKTAQPADYQLEHQFAVPGVGSADGAIGRFPGAESPVAVIELKGAATDLDRDKLNGRTPVQQLWDYLAGLPDCPWGILSNFSVIRLYHRNATPRAYEEFTLQELRRPERFNRFYYLFEKGGLIPPRVAARGRAAELLERTARNEKEIGDGLYAEYQLWRNRLIRHLAVDRATPFDEAVRIAQKLLDRVIFIAFCEDRGLLPADTLKRARERVSAFARVTNPRWQNLLGLFQQVDEGGRDVDLDVGFNGGLFRRDPALDDLDLDDAPWANAFTGFGAWDFRDEVNVDVLGHLFERSITELEKLRVGGLFALTGGAAGEPPNGAPAPAMPRSAERKRFGIYYTPPAFTGLLVERTVDALARERFEDIAKALGVDPDNGRDKAGNPSPEYWKRCIDALRDLKIVDPACGSGAFLIRAYDALETHYQWAVDGLIAARGVSAADLNGIAGHVPEWILGDNLFGVDVSAEAVEITQLALWLRSARPNRTLADLSHNIVCGNSLVSDPAVHERAIDWRRTFPAAFDRPGDRAGFDVVVGNPPWERVKLQEREFFSLTDPETAGAVSAADRRRRIARMPKANPDLHAAYEAARDRAQRMLDYARRSGRYPLTGRGDINTYMLFAELATGIVAPGGLVGLLVPSGIATDETTKHFFQRLVEAQSLVALYDFENKRGHFEDVHRSFKFSAIVFGGPARHTPQADFVFFAHDVDEVAPHNRRRHVPLTAPDLRLLNPNTRTCPIFRTRRDADLTRAIYQRVPVLVDHSRAKGGNPWGVKFLRMFDQTNDAELFRDAASWKRAGFRLRGNRFVKGKNVALPLYEAKMVQAYDHRAASVIVEDRNWVRQGQKARTTPVEHANPEHVVLPRWWVDEQAVRSLLGDDERPAYLCYKDVTSPTNERTMIAAFLPVVAVVNSAPLILPDKALDIRTVCCLLANLNAFVYDFVVRQKVGNVHLNFFIVEQLPTLPPDRYAERCPWSRRETLQHWISERVLKLTCTAEDMRPLARAAGFKGSTGDGVHTWRESERAQLRAELDAAYFHLYQVEREDVEYILSTFTNTGRRDQPDLAGDQSPWGRDSAGDRILRAYDELALP